PVHADLLARGGQRPRLVERGRGAGELTRGVQGRGEALRGGGGPCRAPWWGPPAAASSDRQHLLLRRRRLAGAAPAAPGLRRPPAPDGAEPEVPVHVLLPVRGGLPAGRAALVPAAGEALAHRT